MAAKILFVFGTRPEAIKCFPVIHELRRHRHLDVRVCVTAQHRHMLDQVLEVAEVRPDIDLDIMRDDQTLADLTSCLVSRLNKVLNTEQPNRVIVQGDTTTAMTATLASFYCKIPVGHIEAGLRSRNLYSPWPEEANRRIISIIADLHFAPTSVAAANLAAEGIPEDRIMVTGNTVIDALLFMRDRLNEPEYAAAISRSMPEIDPDKRLIVLTTHRRENFGRNLAGILRAVTRIAMRGDVQIVFPVHPNPSVRAQVEKLLANVPNVLLVKPLEYTKFVWLMGRAYLILTDSGGIQEEAPGLGKPVLVLRNTTERPEGIAAGTARLVGISEQAIVSATERLLDDANEYQGMSSAMNPYGDGDAAKRIAGAISDAATL